MILIARDMYSCLSFNGSSDAISGATNCPEFGSFTYAAWVKRTGTSYGMVIIGDHVGAQYPFFQQAADGSLQLYDTKNGSALVTAGANWELRHKDWTHVAATYNAETGDAVIYVNGLAVVRGSNPAGRTYGPSRISVGRYSGGNYFGGLIDEPVVYPRAFSAEQIADLYRTGNYPDDAVLFFRFDEGLNASTPQAGFPGLPTGSITGSPIISYDVAIVPPMVDQGQTHAFVTDDVNDSINVSPAALTPLLLGATSVTYGMWWKSRNNPSASAVLFYLANTIATALNISIDALGRLAAFARSRDGGASASVSAIPRGLHGQWRHAAVVVDYIAKTMELFLDGRLAGRTTAAGWEDNSYQNTAGAIQHQFPFPSSTGEHAGVAIADIRVGIGIPTKQEVRDWYLTGNFPGSCRLVSNWKIGPGDVYSVRDYGPANIDASIVGSPAIPFGIIARGPFA